MSGWHKPPTRSRRLKHVEKRVKITSPCGRPPKTPGGLVGAFFVQPGGQRHNRWRLSTKWNEITKDTSGFKITLRHYKLEVEYSANGTDWFLHDRFTIPAKDDDDDNAKVHKVVKAIHGRLAYRWRVRAQASGKNGCKSAWSSYLSMGSPVDGPPAPSNVKIKRAPSGILLDWKEPVDVDDDDILDERVSHYVAALYSEVGMGAPSLVQKKRHVKNSHVKFTIDSADELADEDGVFFGKVCSVSSDKSKSAFIPATQAGNDNPAATPSGKTPKYIRRVFTYTISGKLTEKTYEPPERADDDYIIRRVTGALTTPGTGGNTRVDILLNGASIFNNDVDKMLVFGGGSDDASTKQMVTNTIARGNKLKVKVVEVPTVPPNRGTIQVICDRVG